MTCFKPDGEEKTGVARYDGVTVENCFVKNVSRWGIAVGYSYRHKDFATKELSEETFKKYGNENITLKNNYVKFAGGDAITPMYALNPLVEHNVADSCATTDIINIQKSVQARLPQRFGRGNARMHF